MNSSVHFNLVEQTAVLLAVAVFFQLFDGLQATAAGVLRVLQGLEDTPLPMIVALVAYWMLGLTGGYLLTWRFERWMRGLLELASIGRRTESIVR